MQAAAWIPLEIGIAAPAVPILTKKATPVRASAHGCSAIDSAANPAIDDGVEYRA
jgi:hypothetical protein